MKLYTRPAYLELVNDSEHKQESERYNEPSFHIDVVAAPELVALFKKYNITRRGRYTWSLSDNGPEHAEVFQSFYKEYAQKFTPYTLHAAATDNTLVNMMNPHYVNQIIDLAQPLAFNSTYLLDIRTPRVISATTAPFFETTMFNLVKDEIIADSMINKEYKKTYKDGVRLSASNDTFRKEFSPFTLALSLKKDVLYFRLCAIPHIAAFSRINDSSYKTYGFSSKVNGIPYGVTTPNYNMMNITELMSFLDDTNDLFEQSIFSKDSQRKIEQLTKYVSNQLFVNAVPGKPSNVNVLNATNQVVSASVPRLKKNGKPGIQADKKIKIEKFGKTSTTLAEALHFDAKNRKLLIHPSLVDLQNMNNAKEYTDEPRLYGYQRKAVGLQLSTEKGFLNALDTGIGKSIVQLTAMRARAKDIDNYRGIIVCQSNTKTQWKEYALDDKWFPEAKIVIVDSSKAVNRLIDGLSHEGPVVVLATFNMVATVADILEERQVIQETADAMNDKDAEIFIATEQEKRMEREISVAELFVDAHWDDICADEAMSIRNGTASNQSKALWHMRSNSDRATALTATPFNKSIDDIARLLEWVRNEKHMFYGNKLSNLYDQENITEENAQEIFGTLYPMVFRFTKEEAQAEEKEKIKIPEEIAPETLLLDPSPSEFALANACEYELKRILQELETSLDNFEAKTDAEKAEVEAARAELKEAHGHWMAGTNVARMATSNPASIKSSKAVAAQLLDANGLVDAAMVDLPTKQRTLLDRIPKHVAKGQQILIFTDFVDVANTLEELLENNGIRTGVFGGANLKQRDANRIAFQKGELDVLVCTKAAERGLTLHKASVTYHYDMSWTLEPLLQKAGRAARVGSDNESVETYFLILKGTIEEKVVDKVFTQGTLSSMVLDNARGIDIKNTTTGKLMGGLMNASSNINSRRGALEFGKVLLGA